MELLWDKSLIYGEGFLETKVLRHSSRSRQLSCSQLLTSLKFSNIDTWL